MKYTGKIAFITIVGDPKTGKSSLLNNLLGLEHNQFETDPLKQQKTTVLSWIWSVPLYIPHEDKHIFFIDTHGLLEKNEENDNGVGQKVFTILTLISSCLLYNIKGEFNDNTIKRLYLLATLSTSIGTNASNVENENNEEKIKQFFPKLLLLLRDVEKITKDIKIKDKIIKISAKENMESLINDLTKTRNELSLKVKKAIVGLFKERDCLSFPNAYRNSSQIYNHNNENQITAEFFNALMNLREKIEKETEEKVFYKVSLNSRMLCTILQSFVEIANQNGVFDLSIS